MTGRIEVDPEALRAHASGLIDIYGRFDAVRQASAHLFEATDAYGKLCQFLPPVMEDRHQDQDQAVDILSENLILMAEAVNDCADDYEAADTEAAEEFGRLEGELGSSEGPR